MTFLTHDYIKDLLETIYKGERKQIKLTFNSRPEKHKKYFDLEVFSQTKKDNNGKLVRVYRLSYGESKFKMLLIYGILDGLDTTRFHQVIETQLLKVELTSNVKYVYLIESQGFLKIGKADNLDSRMKGYLTNNPKFKLIGFIESTIDQYSVKERQLLAKHRHLLYRGNEWFYYSKDIIDHFKSQDNYVEANLEYP